MIVERRNSVAREDDNIVLSGIKALFRPDLMRGADHFTDCPV
jgi:hypothetical protein